MRAKFGVLQQTQGLHLQAKFQLNVFNVSASGGQKPPQFWANFDIFGAPVQGLHLPAKFHLNVFIVSASNGQKPQFWTNFDNSMGSCTDLLLPMRAKFGVLQQAKGLQL